MSSLTSNFSSHRSLLTRKYDWWYEAKISHEVERFLPLFNELLKISRSLLQPSERIKNIKGRDRLNVIDKAVTLPFEHELASAHITWNPAQFGLSRDDQSEDIQSTIYILSPFESFEENDIFHKVMQTTSGDSPPNFTLEKISSDNRLTLQTFRFGFDMFGQSGFSNWFVKTPVVLESLIIESFPDHTLVKIQSDSHKSLAEGLRDNSQYVSNILAGIKRLLDVDLLSDLSQRCN